MREDKDAGKYTCGDGWHDYAEKTCINCGHVSCYSCSGGTNVDQGGKYDPDYMFCPVCGLDWYKSSKQAG